MTWDRVPVENVLGVLRAHDIEMPELHTPAFADERVAHGVEGGTGNKDDTGDDGDLRTRHAHMCLYWRLWGRDSRRSNPLCWIGALAPRAR